MGTVQVKNTGTLNLVILKEVVRSGRVVDIMQVWSQNNLLMDWMWDVKERN